jgi:ABC-type lipoprotein export system ATPase subunit
VLLRTECQCAYSIESENESLKGMLLSSVLWLVLAWYLGQVVTFGHGRGEWPWFPLTPWFWLPGVKNPLSGRGSAPRVRRDASEHDEDVLAEERAVAEGAAALGRECPVVLQQMVKDFGWLSKFRAVDGLTLSLRSGECFVMLGHNGAGKSTAINMLSGMTSLSGGECTIYGKSVRDSMASIRHEVGVCPQHDILWSDLTAREHLLFYGHFQGMSSAAVRAQGERLLKQVRLDGLNRPAGNYSGGMKRRLSMTIAALGNKRVVFLDEVRAPSDDGQSARCDTTNSSRLPLSRRVVAPASPRQGWTRRTSGTCGT